MWKLPRSAKCFSNFNFKNDTLSGYGIGIFDLKRIVCYYNMLGNYEIMLNRKNVQIVHKWHLPL